MYINNDDAVQWNTCITNIITAHMPENLTVCPWLWRLTQVSMEMDEVAQTTTQHPREKGPVQRGGVMECKSSYHACDE